MTDRQLRDTARIDYKVLSTTGERVLLNQVPRIPKQAGESSDESSTSSGLSDSGSDGSLNRTIVPEPEVDRISQNLKHITLTGMDLIRLQSLEETLYDDIVDFVDENPTEELLVIEDINSCVGKLEDLRSKFRNAHTELRRLEEGDYEDKFKERYDKITGIIKDHISAAKETRNDIRNREVQASAES